MILIEISVFMDVVWWCVFCSVIEWKGYVV